MKNFVQGAIILGTGLLLWLESSLLKSAFLIGVLPTATAVPALAVGNKAYEEVAVVTVLLSTLVRLISIIVGITIVDLM